MVYLKKHHLQLQSTSISLTMTRVNTIMSEFYDVLYKLRYPEITKAEPKNIESIIFTGENRIHLLSWLLTENLPYSAPILTKLEGSALQDTLAKYYALLGICVNKDILLGKCTLEEQLPTLTLLLQFVKDICCINQSDIAIDEEESLTELLKKQFNESTSNSDNITSKLSYSDAINYFEDLKQLDEPIRKNENSTMENLSLEDMKPNKTEQKTNFVLQITKFTDAYESVSSWPVSDVKVKNTVENNMNSYVKNIHSNFSVLKQILHVKDEIPKLEISQEAQRYVPLNSFVEDIVICTDEIICAL